MADPVQGQPHNLAGVTATNGAPPSSNYFDNMESLATAAHAQAQQQPAAYNPQPTAPQQAAVDPMFYLNDPPQQPQQHQQPQFYQQPQTYANTADTAFHSAEQWRQALGGGSVDFQHLLGQVQYPGPTTQQQLAYNLQQNHQTAYGTGSSPAAAGVSVVVGAGEGY